MAKQSKTAPPTTAALLLLHILLQRLSTESLYIATEAKFSKEHLSQGPAAVTVDCIFVPRPQPLLQPTNIWESRNHPIFFTSYQNYFTSSGSHKANH